MCTVVCAILHRYLTIHIHNAQRIGVGIGAQQYIFDQSLSMRLIHHVHMKLVTDGGE